MPQVITALAAISANFLDVLRETLKRLPDLEKPPYTNTRAFDDEIDDLR